MNTVRFAQVAVSHDTRKLLRMLAAAEGRNMSAIVKRALMKYAEDSSDYQNLLNQPISARDAS